MSTPRNSADDLHTLKIIVERTVYFRAPDGSEVKIDPAAYVAHLGVDAQLELTSVDASKQIRHSLASVNIWHNLALNSALALSISTKGDALQIVMLFPGGGALQATGSFERANRSAADAQHFATRIELADAILKSFPLLPPGTHAFHPRSLLKVGFGPLWGTIEPGPAPSAFVPGSVPPNWIRANVTTCFPARGEEMIPVGTPESRNPSPDQLVSLTSVAVNSLVPWTGKTVELLVTAQVVSPGGSARSMTWTDVYQVIPSVNGPVTFPDVIVATALTPTKPSAPGKDTWAQEAASILTSPSGRGAPTEFELRINGITQAFRSCEYLGNFPGGSPQLRCT